jgi:hypothetical protein
MSSAQPRFAVHGVGRFSEQFDGLVKIAEDRGLRRLLAEVLQDILENLETQPRDWGDPYVNYRALNAVGYGRSIQSPGIRVEYTVHDSEANVWITSITALSGSPFA